MQARTITRTRALAVEVAVALSTAIALQACNPSSAAQDAGVRLGAADNPDNADAAPPDPEEVRFSTADGWQIVGDLRARPPGRIATLLVHQLSSNRGEWARYATSLAGAPPWRPSPGTVSTLAIDLRGHGESTQSPEGESRWQFFGNDRARWMGLEHDIAAAVDFMRQRVGATRVVIVASGLGATAASLYAARDNAPVAGLVLISPTLEARGIRIVEPIEAFLGHSGRVLMVTASGDTQSADCVRDVQQRVAATPAASRLEVERYDNTSAHGVALGADGMHPELWPRVTRFVSGVNFQRSLSAAE